MLFITKRKHNRLLKEEREKVINLAFNVGYNTCLTDHYGGKGFITGKDDLFQEIKDYLRRV